MKAAEILVPVNGNSLDKETISLACYIAKAQKGKILAVHVVEIKRSLPLDAAVEPEMQKAEEMLTRAEEIVDELDCEIETDIIQSREAGPAIVNEIIERGIKLVILGLESNKRPGESPLGATITYILKNAPCSVITLRQPLS
jgi:nucleotide-binding universal stress UspA family protein